MIPTHLLFLAEVAGCFPNEFSAQHGITNQRMVHVHHVVESILPGRSVAATGLPGDLVLPRLQELHRGVGRGSAGAVELATAVAVHRAHVRSEVRGLGLEVPGEGPAWGALLDV